MGVKRRLGTGGTLLIVGVLAIGGFFIFKKFVPGGFGSLSKTISGLQGEEGAGAHLKARLEARNIMPITPASNFAHAYFAGGRYDGRGIGSRITLG